MRSLSFVALLAITFSIALPPAAADLATVQLHAGWNTVAPPLVPFDPVPTSVFSGVSFTRLVRFNPANQAEIAYTSPAFGNILLGDGYRIYVTQDQVWNYEGVPDGVPGQDGRMTDMWISTPGNQRDDADAGGMHLIGQPFNHDTPYESVSVTNGTQLCGIAQAVALGWVSGLWSGWDAVNQQEFTVGFPSLSPDDTYLRAGYAYWVQTYRDNLAIIVPAYPVPEPASLAALALGLVGLAGRVRRRA